MKKMLTLTILSCLCVFSVAAAQLKASFSGNNIETFCSKHKLSSQKHNVKGPELRPIRLKLKNNDIVACVNYIIKSKYRVNIIELKTQESASHLLKFFQSSSNYRDNQYFQKKNLIFEIIAPTLQVKLKLWSIIESDNKVISFLQKIIKNKTTRIINIYKTTPNETKRISRNLKIKAHEVYNTVIAENTNKVLVNYVVFDKLDKASFKQAELLARKYPRKYVVKGNMLFEVYNQFGISEEAVATIFNKLFSLLMQTSVKSDFISKVDRRVELVSIVCYLAGMSGYECRYSGPYRDKIDKYFWEKYRDHEAVKTATELFYNKSISYNAPMDLAIRLNHDFSLNQPDTENLLNNVDSRWSKSDFIKLHKVINKFAADTKFMEFFNSNKAFYQKIEDQLKHKIAPYIHEEWFKNFYGLKTKNANVFVLSPTINPHNYGVSRKLNNGTLQAYAINSPRLDEQGNLNIDCSWITLFIHEINHSFMNPLVKKHMKDLQASGTVIFEESENKMRDNAYTTPYIMLAEYMVRAGVICYLKKYSDQIPDSAGIIENHLIYNKRKGFKYLPNLVKKMEEYSDNRDKYHDIKAFMPEIVKFFNKTAAKIKANKEDDCLLCDE